MTRGPRPLLRQPSDPQLPPLLHRPARLAVGELDADGGGDLADPHPHRQRRRGRPHHRAPVPADAPLRRLGRADRRPGAEAAAAPAHPGPPHDRAAGDARPGARRGPRPVDGLRPRLRPRLRQRGRLPDPAGVRDGDGRRRAGRERGQPQQRPRPLGPDRRPGARRRPDRDGRGRALLRPERRQLRGDDLGPAGDGHRGAAAERGRSRASRARSGRASATSAPTPSSGSRSG